MAQLNKLIVDWITRAETSGDIYKTAKGVDVEILRGGAEIKKSNGVLAVGTDAIVVHPGQLKIGDSVIVLQSGIPGTPYSTGAVYTINGITYDETNKQFNISFGSVNKVGDDAQAGDRLFLNPGIAGHRVTLYETDTISQTGYSAPTATNPIPLGAEGRQPYFIHDFAVDIYVSGTVSWPQVEGSHHAGGTVTDAYFTDIQAAPAKTQVDIREFGAVAGDTDFDNGTIIQRAIDYLDSIGGGTVYIPQGDWYVSGTPAYTHNHIALRAHVNMVGEGYQSRIILNSTDDLTMDFLMALGSNLADADPEGEIAHDCRIENVRFSWLAAAEVKLLSLGTGNQNIDINRCHFDAGRFVAGDPEFPTSAGQAIVFFKPAAGAVTDYLEDITIRNCHFFDNLPIYSADQNSSRRSTTTTGDYNVSSNVRVRIIDNMFHDFSVTPIDFFRANADTSTTAEATYVQIQGNQFPGFHVDNTAADAYGRLNCTPIIYDPATLGFHDVSGNQFLGDNYRDEDFRGWLSRGETDEIYRFTPAGSTGGSRNAIEIPAAWPPVGRALHLHMLGRYFDHVGGSFTIRVMNRILGLDETGATGQYPFLSQSANETVDYYEAPCTEFVTKQTYNFVTSAFSEKRLAGFHFHFIVYRSDHATYFPTGLWYYEDALNTYDVVFERSKKFTAQEGASSVYGNWDMTISGSSEERDIGNITGYMSFPKAGGTVNHFNSFFSRHVFFVEYDSLPSDMDGSSIEKAGCQMVAFWAEVH